MIGHISETSPPRCPPYLWKLRQAAQKEAAKSLHHTHLPSGLAIILSPRESHAAELFAFAHIVTVVVYAFMHNVFWRRQRMRNDRPRRAPRVISRCIRRELRSATRDREIYFHKNVNRERAGQLEFTRFGVSRSFTALFAAARRYNLPRRQHPRTRPFVEGRGRGRIVTLCWHPGYAKFFGG